MLDFPGIKVSMETRLEVCHRHASESQALQFWIQINVDLLKIHTVTLLYFRTEQNQLKDIKFEFIVGKGNTHKSHDCHVIHMYIMQIHLMPLPRTYCQQDWSRDVS